MRLTLHGDGAGIWPTSDKEANSRKALAEGQQDPTTKKGVVGAFCRAYDIFSAIETFLPEVYTSTDKEDRYTYAAGSTASGLVVYDGGLFAFSNHGTDPAGGQAYDKRGTSGASANSCPEKSGQGRSQTQKTQNFLILTGQAGQAKKGLSHAESPENTAFFRVL